MKILQQNRASKKILPLCCYVTLQDRVSLPYMIWSSKLFEISNFEIEQQNDQNNEDFIFNIQLLLLFLKNF